VKEYWKFLKQLLPFVGIGVVIVAIALVWILHVQRGAHVELRGSIQKVRTLPMDDQSSVAIVDFRMLNPSDYPFLVRKVEVGAVGPSGAPLESSVVSEVDAKKLFQYFPQLGPKYNDTLLMNTRIHPKQSIDRMIAARFEVPEKVLQHRQNLRLHVEEINGPVADIFEKQP
jgi:hypothetical protein